jgi:predicted DNA-binding WGR domain protein
MKIRIDFVTNSSSSGYGTINVKNSILIPLIKELLDSISVLDSDIYSPLLKIENDTLSCENGQDENSGIEIIYPPGELSDVTDALKEAVLDFVEFFCSESDIEYEELSETFSNQIEQKKNEILDAYTLVDIQSTSFNTGSDMPIYIDDETGKQSADLRGEKSNEFDEILYVTEYEEFNFKKGAKGDLGKTGVYTITYGVEGVGAEEEEEDEEEEENEEENEERKPTMKRTFIYTDAKSNKFWSIDAATTSFTVNFGKTGTNGQTSLMSYDTEAECEKEVAKRIAEKVKKGYVEQ